jgi:hypothetical protein
MPYLEDCLKCCLLTLSIPNEPASESNHIHGLPMVMQRPPNGCDLLETTLLIHLRKGGESATWPKGVTHDDSKVRNMFLTLITSIIMW